MRFVGICLVLLLSGCTLMKRQRVERQAVSQIDIPEFWRTSGEGNEGAISSGWLATFNDPEMSALVSEALNRNQGIRISEANLRIAQESLVIGRSPRLPSFSLSGSGSGSGTRRRVAGDLQPWDNSESYGLTASASWELDVWGRLKDLNQAAKYDLLATRADFRGARLSLAAATAGAWCNLITAKQQLELAKRTKLIFEANFRITERNYKNSGDAGASALSVQLAGNNVASAERNVISRQLAYDEAKRTLEVLLGRYPGTALEGREILPEMPDEIPTGLPSELLMRRPDLVAASNDLLASAERAVASRKGLLPAINLTARGSVGAENIADVIGDPTSIARSVAASLSQPVFQGGRLKAQVRQAELRNQIAVESFVATALRAFREVESAIDRDRSLAEQAKFLEIEFAQANLAEAQATRDYADGIVTIINVLEAQRRAFNARSSRISLRNQRLQNRIDLHLALGGDFSSLPEAWDESETSSTDDDQAVELGLR